MHSRRADNSADTVFSHTHLSADDNSRVNSAYGVKAESTVGADVGDHEAHFVHVGAYHKFLFGSFLSFFEADETAEGVGAVFAQPLDLLYDKLSYSALIA